MTSVPPGGPRRRREAARTQPVDPVTPNPTPTTYVASTAPPPEPSKLPTNKLLGAAITAVILYGLSLVTDVNPTIEQAAIALGPLIAAWFVTNARTPGGVPLKK